MLCLSESDILEAASPNEIVDKIESAMVLYEGKEFQMPDRMHVDYQGNTLLLMPCFAGKSLGTKLVTLFPENVKKNIPVLYGVMSFNDGQTGEPLAILNGSALTALRTGAVGSVSIRHLVPENVHVLGIVGAGVQGLSQAVMACSQRRFTKVFVYDLFPDKVDSFAMKFTETFPEISVVKADSVENLLMESEVVIAATASQEPVLPDEEQLLSGKHFVGIGSYKPNMREFPAALFKLLKVMYVDTDHALKESGDVIDPIKNHWIEENQVFTLGKLIISEDKRHSQRKQTTLFKSVGMALFDLAVSELIYERAIQKGLGQKVSL